MKGEETVCVDDDSLWLCCVADEFDRGGMLTILREGTERLRCISLRLTELQAALAASNAEARELKRDFNELYDVSVESCKNLKAKLAEANKQIEGPRKDVAWLTAAMGEQESLVKHPLDADGKLNKKATYCYNCGTMVKNQKYCHGCGRLLLWSYKDRKAVRNESPHRFNKQTTHTCFRQRQTN